MRKSLITTAVLGALAAPSFVFAAEAAPASDLTVAYNVGLYSQYIFRGLTQTDRKPALQGGVDLTHSSGFYLGAWGSNVSWLTDGNNNGAEAGYYNSGGSLEIDIYGGYRTEIAKSGITLDVGALQYYYPGHRRSSMARANTTEVYGALSYGWLQAKLSGVVSPDAWGTGDARGTYYAELNANVPLSDLAGAKDGLASGITGLVHVARQDFDGVNSSAASYNDYKIGVQKTFDGSLNVGAFWSKANTKSSFWTIDNKNIGDSTGTVYIQKTF